MKAVLEGANAVAVVARVARMVNFIIVVVFLIDKNYDTMKTRIDCIEVIFLKEFFLRQKQVTLFYCHDRIFFVSVTVIIVQQLLLSYVLVLMIRLCFFIFDYFEFSLQKYRCTVRTMASAYNFIVGFSWLSMSMIVFVLKTTQIFFFPAIVDQSINQS